MATVDKDRILVGDTYLVKYSCWKRRNARGYRTANDLAVGPDSTAARDAYAPLMAEVQLWSVRDQLFVPLDGTNTTAVASIDANVASYLITEDHFAVDGDFKVFMTCTFPDGQVITQARSFQVKQRQ